MAAHPQLVRAINDTTLGSMPHDAVAFNGAYYFAATDAAHGTELWRTDGTAAGTVLVKDTVPGPNSGNVANLKVVDGVLYFGALAPTSGYDAIWRSDGTTAGTLCIDDISGSVAVPDLPREFTKLNGRTYFLTGTTDRSSAGGMLWVTDGTTYSTAPAASFLNSYPGHLTLLGDELVLAVSGRGVYRSDGTTTEPLTPDGVRYDGLTGSSPGNVRFPLIDDWQRIGDTIYFAATDAAHGAQLWETDGTAAGTTIVSTAIPTGTRLDHLVAIGSRLVFRDVNTNNNRSTLWTSDGTDAGTQQVTALNPDPAQSSIFDVISFGGEAYFAGSEPTYGSELYKTDGTAAGTSRVTDINFGAASFSPQYLTVGDDGVYMWGTDGVHGRELWRSDGTADGTTELADIAAGAWDAQPREGSALARQLHMNYIFPLGPGLPTFFAADDANTGLELYKTDGTPAGTARVADINTAPASTSIGNPVVLPNGLAAFAADDGRRGSEPWVSDGTAAGTRVLADISPAFLVGSNPALFTRVGDLVFFRATDPTNGTELWLTEGTPGGTRLVKNINAGNGSSSPTALVNLSGTLLFWANDGSGVALWRSDGTDAGTTLVRAATPAPAAALAAGAQVYFVGGDGKLWASDGTAAGTGSITPAGNPTLAGISLVSSDATGVYFKANSSQLCHSDGTANGTVMLKSNLTMSNAVAFAGATYFNGSDGSQSELWRSDGTAGGTSLVIDLNGTSSSNPLNLTAIGTTLYFTVGTQLWKSDGTAANTQLVTTVGTFGSAFAGAGGTLYFAAADAAHGQELWQSDGTAAGTFMTADIFPGTSYSFPGQTLDLNGVLLFTANDGAHGTQLWKYDVVPPTVVGAAYELDAAPPRVAATFSEDVSATVDTSDVAVVDLATNQPLAAGVVQVSAGAGHSIWIRFSGAGGNGALLDGNYRLTIAAAGVSDDSGNALAGGDVMFDFFTFAGDANHDRTVDLTDFTVLAANFNGTNKSFSQGDFDYSGTVDLTDFTILASRFNQTLAAPAAAPAPVAAHLMSAALAPASSTDPSSLRLDTEQTAAAGRLIDGLAL